MMSGGDGQPETLGGVTVTLGGEHAMGESAETDMTGGFAFTGLRAGTYTVTISGFPEDVSFETLSMDVEVEVGEVGNADFTGHFIRTSAVAGQVIIEGEGLAGVTVTLAGGPADESYTSMTDAEGMYSFAELRPGSYTISISDFDSRDYEFASTSQDVSVNLDETGTVSFTGVLLRTSGIAGRVSVEGMGLDGITVTLSMADAEDMTTMTADGGQYAFAGLAAGDYTVSIAVESDAYVFESMSMDVTVADDESKLASFDGMHARTSSVSGMLFIDEAMKNDMHDEGEHPLTRAGFPVALVGPGVNEQRTAVTDENGQFTFPGLRSGAYQLVALVDGTVGATLAAGDLAFGGAVTGYSFDLGVGEAKSQNLPFDITHTTINVAVTLKGGDHRGDPVPGAMVDFYADADGETKVASGMTEAGEQGVYASIKVARAGTSDHTVHMAISSDDYFVDPTAGMQAVTWNPQSFAHPAPGSDPAAVLNDADIVNLNVEVAVSGATVTRGDMGGEALDGWPISVMMGEGDDAEAVEGAPDMLDDMGMASFEYAVGADALPAMFSFAVTEEEVDGEMIASEAVDYTHTGLSMAGGEVALEASFATQTLMAYVHHERDQVMGYTGEALLGGDERMSKMVDIEVRYVSSSGRAVRFDEDEWDGKMTDKDGVVTFTRLPADMNVIVIATPAEDTNVRIIGDDEVAAYGDDANVSGGLFGENGGWSSKVKVPSFAFVHTYAVDGQVWKNGVEMEKFGDGFVMHLFEDDDPVTESGVMISLDPVEGENLAEENASALTLEKDDKDTDVNDTKEFDFGRMADGAYSLGVSPNWMAMAGGEKLDKLFVLSDEADDGKLNIDVTPATGIVYGRVMGKADGLPLAGVHVNVNGADAAAMTDEHGRYIVEGFGKKQNKAKKDALIVTMSHKGVVQTDTVAQAFAANDPKHVLDRQFEGTAQVATISGKVTEAGSDKGLAGVTITVTGTDVKLHNPNAKSRSSLEENDIYKTRADGTYSVQVSGVRTAPASDRVTVTPMAKEKTFTPSSYTESVSAGTNNSSRHFTAFDYATITGRVRAGTTGVQYIKVEAKPEGASDNNGNTSTLTGSTGAFRLRVPHGSYSIRLPSNSGYDFKLNDVAATAVEADDQADVVEVASRSVAPGQVLALGTIMATKNGGDAAPVFTSSPTFSVEERKTVIGKVTAVNPAGGDVKPTFSSYTVDAAAEAANTGTAIISVASTGELTFTAPNGGPVFDPETASNNVYKGTVTATVGAATAEQMITIRVTNVGHPTVTFKFNPDKISERGDSTEVTATVDQAFDRTVFVTVQFQDVEDEDNPTAIDLTDTNSPLTARGNLTLVFVRGSLKSEGSLWLDSNNNNTYDENGRTIAATADVEAFFTANGVRVEEFKADKPLTIEDDDASGS